MTLPRLTFTWTALFPSLLLLALCAGTWPTLAQAGCNMNLIVENKGQNTIFLDKKKSKVKTHSGLWKSLFNAGWDPPNNVRPGMSVGDNWHATYGCMNRRKYQITYSCNEGPYKGSSFTSYYPSASATWTRGQSKTIPVSKCK